MSKSYNLLIRCLSVTTDQENAGSWLLQILYDNYDSGKHVSSSSIAGVLEIDKATVIEGLSSLMEAGLVDSSETGYRLSEKGYMIAVQRATSFCPHL